MTPRPLRTLLVALDESPRAPQVLALAEALAERHGAVLRVLHVVYLPPEFPPAGAGYPADELAQRLADRARDMLTRVCAPSSPALIIEEPVVTEQAPWRVIVARAARPDIDLVVMGSHGRTVIDWFLGTTAAHVVDRCTKDVYVVKWAAD